MRRIGFFSGVVLAILALVNVCMFVGSVRMVYAQEETGSISGHVYDAETGEPIEGVCINWASCSLADGSYTITVTPGAYYVCVTGCPPGYVKEAYKDTYDEPEWIKVSAGSHITDIDFTLEKGGAIAGHVYQEDGSTSIPNIALEFDHTSPPVWHGLSGSGAITDSTGIYVTQEGLLPGEYQIIIYSQAGYIGQERYGIVVTGRDTTYGVDFILQRGGAIAGHVYEEDGVTPIPTGCVAACRVPTGPISPGRGETGVWSDGSYIVSGLPDGDYTVHVESDEIYLKWYYGGCPPRLVHVSAPDTVWGIDIIRRKVKTASVSNSYIQAIVSDGKGEGSFVLATTGGSPTSVLDDDKDLLFGYPIPNTSFTTFSVGDEPGEPGQVNRFGGWSGTSVVQPHVQEDGHSIEYVDRRGNTEIKQVVSLVPSRWSESQYEDTAQITYVITNLDSTSHLFGLRMVLDTMLGANDGAPINIPFSEYTDYEREFDASNMPPWWQAVEGTVSDPIFTTQGTLIGFGATKPDRLVTANWTEIAETLWDYTIDPDRRVTNDSAIAMWWSPVTLEPGASRTIVTYYGLGSGVTAEGELALNLAAPSVLEIEDGQYAGNPFVANLIIQNTGAVSADSVVATLNVPQGLSVAVDSVSQYLGRILPEEQMQVSWSILADGSARGVLSYSIEVTSSNTPSNAVSAQIYIPPIVTVSIPDTSGAPDETIVIPIRISDATSVAGSEIVLSFNPEVLTANNAEKTELTSGFSLGYDVDTPGKALISLAQATGIEGGSGDLVKITFVVAPEGTSGDTTLVAIKSVSLYDEITRPIGAVIRNGTFTIVPGELASIRVSPDSVSLMVGDTQRFTADGFDAVGNPVEIAPLCSVIGEIGTIDTTGLFTATALGEGQVIVRQGSIADTARVTVSGLLGDINADGLIDVRDAIICLRIVAELSLPPLPLHESPTAYEEWAADMDENGEINPADALLILYKSFDRLRAKPVSSLAGVEAAVRLADVLESEGLITVLILVQNRPDVCAADVRLSYDPGLVRPVEVKAGASDALLVANTQKEGRIIAALISTEGLLASDGSLLSVSFEVKGDLAGRDAIQFEKIRLFDSSAEPIRVRMKGGLALTEMAIPQAYGLSQNFPNPFNTSTEIRYKLPQEDRVTLRVYNLSGQIVRTLVDSRVEAGQWSVLWDGKDENTQEVSSGIYFYRLMGDGGVWTEARRMILIK